MTTDTLFDLASVTKPVATAMSVMILVDQGIERVVVELRADVRMVAARIDVGRHVEAVGRHAQDDVRISGPHPGKGFQGFPGVGKRIAGSGNPHHGNITLGGEYFLQIDHGLTR